MFQYVWETFSFWDIWHPEWMAATILFAVIYLGLIGPLRPRFQDAPPVKAGQKAVFLSGLLVIYITLGSPLYLIGTFQFSIHMLQMALFYLVMPPLLLIGTPAWVLRPIFKYRPVKKGLSIFTNPLISIFLFNGLLTFYHFPVVFDAINSSVTFDTISHLILLITAFFMWWPILCPIPEMDRLTELHKMGVICANGIVLYPVCALIILADTLMYNTYAQTPQLFSFLTPIRDQQLGGVVMKIVQEGALGVALGYMFYKWVQREIGRGIDARDTDPNISKDLVSSELTSSNKD